MNQFNETERQVFRYFDGQNVAGADPMRIHRRLTAALDGDPQLWLTQYRSDDAQVRSDAVERLVPGVLFAFELPGFDRLTCEGMMEEDVLNLLRTFMEWMDTQKKTAVSLPTSSPPTVAPSSADASSATRTSSASGSVSAGCGCS